MHWGVRFRSTACRLWGLQDFISGGETRGKNCRKSSSLWGAGAKTFQTQTRNPKFNPTPFIFPQFPVPKVVFQTSPYSICRLRKFALRKSVFCARGGFRPGAESLILQNGVGKFAFCGGSDRLQYCGICAFRGVSIFARARQISRMRRAVAVSHSELRISFCSAVKNISKTKSGH